MATNNETEIITIGFSLSTNAYDGKYIMKSQIPIYYEAGNTPIEEIFSQFNIFLKQAGYVRPNDYILTESLTEDEREELEYHLSEYRINKNNTKEEE